MPIKDIKEMFKALFLHWMFSPTAIVEIISETRQKPLENVTTKLDIYKKFYK